LEKAKLYAEAALGAATAVHDTTASGKDKQNAKDYARLKRLELDYELKIAAFDLDVNRYTRPEQGLAAAALSMAYREIVKLQIMFGYQPTPRDPRVTRVDAMRVAYNRANAAGEIS
jgi:hypothetical protein